MTGSKDTKSHKKFQIPVIQFLTSIHQQSLTRQSTKTTLLVVIVYMETMYYNTSWKALFHISAVWMSIFVSRLQPGSLRGRSTRLFSSCRHLLGILLLYSIFLESNCQSMNIQMMAFAKPLVKQGSRTSLATSLFSSAPIQKVGIVGGGLAGLSTAYHLIEKSPSLDVTIIDKAMPGEAGASSVAGG